MVSANGFGGVIRLCMALFVILLASCHGDSKSEVPKVKSLASEQGNFADFRSYGDDIFFVAGENAIVKFEVTPEQIRKVSDNAIPPLGADPVAFDVDAVHHYLAVAVEGASTVTVYNLQDTSSSWNVSPQSGVISGIAFYDATGMLIVACKEGASGKILYYDMESVKAGSPTAAELSADHGEIVGMDEQNGYLYTASVSEVKKRVLRWDMKSTASPKASLDLGFVFGKSYTSGGEIVAGLDSRVYVRTDDGVAGYDGALPVYNLSNSTVEALNPIYHDYQVSAVALNETRDIMVVAHKATVINPTKRKSPRHDLSRPSLHVYKAVNPAQIQQTNLIQLDKPMEQIRKVHINAKGVYVLFSDQLVQYSN